VLAKETTTITFGSFSSFYSAVADAADVAAAHSFPLTTVVADAISSLSFFFSPAVVAATVSVASNTIRKHYNGSGHPLP